MVKKVIISLLFSIFFCFNTIISLQLDLKIADELKSESILLYNINSESIVYEKNSNKRRSPASLTKILTYIIADEFFENKNDKILVKKELIDLLEGTDSSTAGLKPGHEYTIKEIMYAMMIPSGNEASLILADAAGQGIDKFVDKMNDKAISLGCSNSYFKNVHGLYDENHYTTCIDLLKIINYAITKSDFNEIVKTQSFELDGVKVENTNKLLDSESKYYYKNAYGIKTGYCSEAGRCLASISEKNGEKYVCIVMGAPEDDKDKKLNLAMIDSRKIYEYVFNKFKVLEIPKSKINLPKIRTRTLGSLVPVNNIDSIKIVVPRNIRINDITVDVNIPDIDSPVFEGEKIGKINIISKDSLLKCVDVVSSKNIKNSFFKSVIFTLRSLFKP